MERTLLTMEAEIIVMVHCCRELFPVVAEIRGVVGLETKDLVSVGALVLAETIPLKFTPRSEYYAIKTVWFQEEIQKHGVQLLKIEMIEQLEDIFMKGLARATFDI